MDKKSKEALRRYKKVRMAARQRSSSESSSSSSDSGSSYSSSGSEHRRRKKARQGAGQSRRSSSSSGDERRKREKREHCQKKLEAKRNHLKRKLKEAKLRKRAAAAAAVLSGQSHRALSPTTQAKLKKLAERKHLRAQSKERREREREKHRAAAREREREHRRSHSRSPTKITKIRIHQDVKRQKSPPRMHHQMMSREKIIIQARTRSHTPSAERERLRHEQKLRHEDIERRERERDRVEREAARDKERAEALARCQERQRERERIAREKLRREEEEKKYGGERGLVARPTERDVGMGSSRAYKSRERSMDSERGRHISKRELDPVYEREREYLEADRRGLINREDIRREREYIVGRHRELSPVGEHYSGMRDIYDDERERAYVPRPYLEEPRHPREREAGWLPRELHERELREPREFRGVDHDIRYAEEREREIMMRERSLAARGEWKPNWGDSPGRGSERNWEEGGPHSRSGFVGGPKRGGGSSSGHTKIAPTRERTTSETDWDTNEDIETKAEKIGVRESAGFASGGSSQRDAWVEHDLRDVPREKIIPGGRPPLDQFERRWQPDWREPDDVRLGPEALLGGPMHHHRAERGRGGFRRGMDHSFRGHAPTLIPPMSYGVPRFPHKRNMTYTNPNLIKKQQAAAKAAAQASAVAAATTAVAAAKAAAQSAANATTNPGILGQVSGIRQTTAADNEKPEAGEILPDQEEMIGMESESKTETIGDAALMNAEDNKVSGELSEISDSDDDILNKAERKSKSELDEIVNEIEPTKMDELVTEKTDDTIGAVLERANDDDEMLDFEEISDGELEEEARQKGVGDALGVDWASLIAETKPAQPVAEQSTTAKQKWQAHRIILDVGISMRMAGEEYAKRLIAEAQQKLETEQLEFPIKSEIKEEISSTADEDSQTTDPENANPSDIDRKPDIKNINIKCGEELTMETNNSNLEQLHPLACVQVAQRKRELEQRHLFANACGPNSRALSARQDLRLRRQLCGLPAEETNLPEPMPKVSEKLKEMALAAFKRTLEVK